MSARLDRHGEFVLLLNGWKARSYTDGGPALKRSDRRQRRAQRAARKRQRVAA